MSNTIPKMKCLIIDDEPLARFHLKELADQIDFLSVEGTCATALEADTKVKETEIDLLFLDINMPGISGIQLSQSLKTAPLIIFTTAYSHYAVDSYTIGAVDYLLKPITYERFQTAIEKADKAVHTSVETMIYLKSGPQTHAVKLSDILYLEKDGNYMTVHLKDKHILIRENMSGIFDLVPAIDFIRVHKSYVVAIKHVTMIEAHQLTVKGEKIPVGSSYHESVRARLGLN